MATFSDARAIYGLSATATPTSTNVSGSLQIGVAQTQSRLADANVAYSLRAVIVDGATLSVDFSNGITTGSTAWVAGTAQIETATVVAASGITGSGNATVTVTAAGMTGSPKAISVALTTAEHTTATLIATAIAAALNVDTDYSALFTATSSGANVITTRKSLWSGTPSLYPANDSTLNVAIANGTCTGITTAATSTNTLSGVASSGVKIYDGDALDVEGDTFLSMDEIHAVLFEIGDNAAIGDLEIIQSGWNNIPTSILPGTVFQSQFITGNVPVTATFTADGDTADITITAIGKYA